MHPSTFPSFYFRGIGRWMELSVDKWRRVKWWRGPRGSAIVAEKRNELRIWRNPNCAGVGKKAISQFGLFRVCTNLDEFWMNVV